MPNWCCNEERITGSREEILPLHKKLLEWTSRNYMENGFGHLWLGNIVLGAGFKVDGNGKNYLRCKGALLEEPMLYDDEETPCISFSSETAWAPLDVTWQRILERHASSCRYIFRAEECGMGYYATNDRDGTFFPEDFLIDCYMEEPCKVPKELLDATGYETEAWMREFLQKLLKLQSNDTDGLVKRFNHLSKNGAFGKNTIKIHRIERVV